MRTACVVAVVALLVVLGRFAYVAFTPAKADHTELANVVRVLDGDTVIARVGSVDEHVRVIGVDTPEISHRGRPAQCYSLRAKRFVERTLTGHRVQLTRGREQRDRYGRLLAYVRVEGASSDLESALLNGGFGRTLTFAPNDDRAAAYRSLETRARARGAGLWGHCSQGVTPTGG